MLRMASNGANSLSWGDFRQLIRKLVPVSLEDQITLFLRAYVPKDLPQEQVDKYKFGK